MTRASLCGLTAVLLFTAGSASAQIIQQNPAPMVGAMAKAPTPPKPKPADKAKQACIWWKHQKVCGPVVEPQVTRKP